MVVGGLTEQLLVLYSNTAQTLRMQAPLKHAQAGSSTIKRDQVMAAFARAAVYEVAGEPAQVFESASASSARLGERQPGEELSVVEVRGEWLRVKATALSKGGWVTGAGCELVPSPAAKGSLTLEVYHPEKEDKLKLCEICVQRHESLGRVCELIEELTGLKESAMIPVEGVKTDYGESLSTFHSNLPKINWVACSKTKTVGELYAEGDQFMYTYIGEVDAVLYPDFADGDFRRFSTLESGESWKDTVTAEQEEEDDGAPGGFDFERISLNPECAARVST